MSFFVADSFSFEPPDSKTVAPQRSYFFNLGSYI